MLTLWAEVLFIFVYYYYHKHHICIYKTEEKENTETDDFMLKWLAVGKGCSCHKVSHLFHSVMLKKINLLLFIIW